MAGVIIEEIVDDPPCSLQNDDLKQTGDKEEAIHRGGSAVGEGATAESAATAEGNNASKPSETLDPAALEALQRAEELKAAGNELYRQGLLDGAVAKYLEALEVAPRGADREIALYHCNLAACYLALQKPELAVEQATLTLQLAPDNLKALRRRAKGYQTLDELEKAVADLEKVCKQDPSDEESRRTLAKLMPEVEKRREKMKEEMLGKLKELGNTVLGKFGMSLDNFKAEKDPATGSYSIKFNQ